MKIKNELDIKFIEFIKLFFGDAICPVLICESQRQ